MKTSLAILAALILTGCATTSNGPEVQGKTAADIRHFIRVTEPGYRVAAKTVCALVINTAVQPADRAEVKAAVSKISSVIAASNGQDPAAFEAGIAAQLPEQYKPLAPAISALYAVAFPFIKGDPQLLLKVTSDLAAGCADATRTP